MTQHSKLCQKDQKADLVRPFDPSLTFRHIEDSTVIHSIVQKRTNLSGIDNILDFSTC
jgi:hypothetical protein